MDSQKPTKQSLPSGRIASSAASPPHLHATEGGSFSLEDLSPGFYVGAVALVAAFVWSFWPTLAELVAAWEREPDYSHGYLVAPLALFALWLRKDSFPKGSLGICWYGLLIVAAAMTLRTIAGLYYVGGVEGWAMVLYIAGACLLLGGWRFFLWSWPAVAFLVFMIPLPFSVEQAMRLPLQGIATRLSCWMLQCLGQPALVEGYTILMGEHQLNIEEACSGLRIFVAIAVLAFAYIMIVRPTWWERIVLLVAIVPIALISNALRIVVTGLLYQFVSGESARHFSHDLAGWMMIPLAAAMFFLVLWYLSKLMKEVEVVSMQDLLQSHPT